MALQKQSLSDGKSAAVVTINGSTAYLRVRKVATVALDNSSGDSLFTDAAVKVQAYMVGGDGIEIPDSAGPVIGETVHGQDLSSGEYDSDALIARLAQRAIDQYISSKTADTVLAAIPNELV